MHQPCMPNILESKICGARAVLIFLFAGLLFSGRFNFERLVDNTNGEARWLFLGSILLMIMAHPRRLLAIDMTFAGICLLLSIFVGLHFLSAMISPLYDYNSLAYLVNLCIVFLLSFLTIIIFSKNTTGNVSILAYWGLFIGAVYVCLVLYSSLFGHGRSDITIGGPNVMTRVLFMSFCFLLFLSNRVANNSRFLLIPLIFLFLSAIVLIGSRAGIAATAFALGLIILKQFGQVTSLPKALGSLSKRGIYRFAVSVPIATLAASLAWSTVSEYFETRFIGLVLNRFHWSGRDSIYSTVWSDIRESLWTEQDILGPGFLNYLDYVNYPHNVFLEVAYNSGVLGVTLLLIFTAISGATFFRATSRNAFIAIIPIYMLMVSFFSGDIYDFRYFFIFLLISLALGMEHSKLERKVSLTKKAAIGE